MGTRRRNRAFSLVEILVVIGIIGLVLGMIISGVLLVRRAVDGFRPIDLTSSAFEQGQPIPAIYTADGQDISPPLAWTNVPQNAGSLAIVMTEWGGISHVDWILVNLPPNLTELPPGGGVLPAGALVGTDDLGNVGYLGPNPKPGSVYYYRFEIFALDGKMDLGQAPPYAAVKARMAGHVLQSGQLAGTCSR